MDLQEHKTIGNKKAKIAYVKRYFYLVGFILEGKKGETEKVETLKISYLENLRGYL